MQTHANPLLSLPLHLLARITGERRRRLLEYLLRWGEPTAALQALDCWLAAQPQLVTLREARARVQLELGMPETTLTILDELDAERGMSVSRRDLRLRALAAVGRWDQAYALLQPLDSVGDWRLYAELLRRQGRFDEAAAAYGRAGELIPAGSAPLRGLAELALARGDLTGARAIIQQRLQQFPDMPPEPRDLRLLRAIAERQHAPPTNQHCRKKSGRPCANTSATKPSAPAKPMRSHICCAAKQPW